MFPELTPYQVGIPMPKIEKISENLGHLGDSSKATVKKGEKIVETV